MSNSDIGALKNKNICNHLFVVYSIINSVHRGESRMTCMTLSLSGQNDKLTLLYKSNVEIQVAVKTPVGTTERINMPRIMMQGVSWGSMQCSNSIDKIGKRCEEERENLYTHKNLVKLPVPSMVDDMLAVSTCGHESLSTNTHINAQIELEKLRFHAPDAQGKTKCHNLHVAPEKSTCPDLKVHGSKMQLVAEDTYLGDLVRADGKNDSNIRHRVSKCLGIISQIMRTLETVSFGNKYFAIALSLRQAMFINGVLTNVDIWYHLTKAEIDLL